MPLGLRELLLRCGRSFPRRVEFLCQLLRGGSIRRLAGPSFMGLTQEDLEALHLGLGRRELLFLLPGLALDDVDALLGHPGLVLGHPGLVLGRDPLRRALLDPRLEPLKKGVHTGRRGQGRGGGAARRSPTGPSSIPGRRGGRSGHCGRPGRSLVPGKGHGQEHAHRQQGCHDERPRHRKGQTLGRRHDGAVVLDHLRHHRDGVGAPHLEGVPGHQGGTGIGSRTVVRGRGRVGLGLGSAPDHHRQARRLVGEALSHQSGFGREQDGAVGAPHGELDHGGARGKVLVQGSVELRVPRPRHRMRGVGPPERDGHRVGDEVLGPGTGRAQRLGPHQGGDEDGSGRPRHGHQGNDQPEGS